MDNNSALFFDNFRAVNLSVAKQVFYTVFQLYLLNPFNVNYIARRNFPCPRAPPLAWTKKVLLQSGAM